MSIPFERLHEPGDASECRGRGGTANAVEAAVHGWQWARPFDNPSPAETHRPQPRSTLSVVANPG